MSATPCERCERPVDDAHVCSLCALDAEKALGNVPALAHEIDVTIARQHRLSAQSDGGRSAETPVPFHVRASDARDVLRNVMVGWSKMYAEEYPRPEPFPGVACENCLHVICSRWRLATRPIELPADNLEAMSRFLLSRIEWFRHHELAATFVDEVVTACGAIGRVIDAPANRTTFAVGPCPEIDEQGLHCAGEVRAFIPASEDGAARMECAQCETQYATWQWLRAGKRILERRDTLIALTDSIPT